MRSCAHISPLVRYIVCGDILCGVGLVVHEKELNLAGVVDEEDLVAGWGHVLGLLVGTIADLNADLPC